MREIEHRMATMDDCSMPADLNLQFLLEEGHRNVFLPHLGPSPQSIPKSKLEERMRRWLSNCYSGVLFTDQGQVIAYALYLDDEYELYLQQFYVVPGRRREGVGRRCYEILRSDYWPRNKRLSLGVSAENVSALAFWRAMGYEDYSYELYIPPDE